MVKNTLVSLLFVMLSMPVCASATSQEYDSDLNDPSNWGANCIKFDDFNGGVRTWDASRGDVVKVIVKGGTENAVYTTAPFTGLTAPVNPRSEESYDISHVIECYEVDETEPCNYDQALQADDDNCRPNDDCATECDGQGGDTPTDPIQVVPQVLGNTTESVAPTEPVLAETGISSLLGLAIGGSLICVSALLYKAKGSAIPK